MDNNGTMNYHPDAESALAPLWPLFDWPSVRRHKCLALYTLAREAKETIVELGTYHGTGTIALAIGARDGHHAYVYTVDPFDNNVGWIGEHYTESDRNIFNSNLDLAGITSDVALFREHSECLVQKWGDDIPIDLLFWDIGGNRLYSDYLKWYRHIAHNGLFVAKDLHSWQFGFGACRDHALVNGFIEDKHYPEGCMWCLRKL